MTNELKAKMSLDASQAEKQLDRLCKKFDALTAAANRLNDHIESSKMTRGMQKVNDVVVKATTNLDKATVRADVLTGAFTKSADAVSKVAMKAGDLSNKFGRLSTPLNFVQTKLENVATSIRNARKATTKWMESHQRVKSAVSRLTTMYHNTASKLTNIGNKVRTWWQHQKMVNSVTRSTNAMLDSTLSRIKSIAATYLGIMGTKAIIGLSDTMTSSENKLNYTNATALGDKGYKDDGSYSVQTLQATQAAMDKMYASSQKVRMSYTDMMTSVSKTMALAGDAFQNNTDNAIRFQEIMAEAYAVGGASAQEMSSSMYQLTQALGAGVLAGDELRSVREGAPLAYAAIEEFAQGVYNTEESLKDLGSQGKITSEMVVAAIMNAGDEMDKAFAQTAQTFDQAWIQIVNAAQYAFKPVSEMLRTMLNDAIDNGLIQKVEEFMVVISKTVQIIVTVIGNAINWILENWSWVYDVLIAGISTLTILLVASAIKAMVAWAIANWQIILVATAIFIVIYALLQWQQGAIDTTQLILICLGIIATGLLILAIALQSTALFWVAVIVAALGVVLMFFEEVCGGVMWLGAVILDAIIIVYDFIVAVINAILGVILWVCATLWNIFAGLINGILELVWSAAAPIVSVVEWILNACNGGFNSFGGAVANLIGQIIGWFLNLGKVVTKIIDAIFGTNWTAGLNSLKNEVVSWGKNEKAITIEGDIPELPRIDATNAFNTGSQVIPYAELVNPMDAYDTGYNWGAGVKESINDWGSGLAGKLSDKMTGLTNLDKIGKNLGLNFDSLNGGFPSASDPANAAGNSYVAPSNSDLAKGVGGIGDDTARIADSMELSEEDLEYLRKAAELEWKKEFTTASITVDMSNYNTINGDGDLDGIVTRLTDRLYEELSAVADGVYV